MEGILICLPMRTNYILFMWNFFVSDECVILFKPKTFCFILSEYRQLPVLYVFKGGVTITANKKEKFLMSTIKIIFCLQQMKQLKYINDNSHACTNVCLHNKHKMFNY